jgi:hypothetical protein
VHNDISDSSNSSADTGLLPMRCFYMVARRKADQAQQESKTLDAELEEICRSAAQTDAPTI